VPEKIYERRYFEGGSAHVGRGGQILAVRLKVVQETLKALRILRAPALWGNGGVRRLSNYRPPLLRTGDHGLFRPTTGRPGKSFPFTVAASIPPPRQVLEICDLPNSTAGSRRSTGGGRPDGPGVAISALAPTKIPAAFLLLALLGNLCVKGRGPSKTKDPHADGS